MGQSAALLHNAVAPSSLWTFRTPLGWFGLAGDDGLPHGVKPAGPRGHLLWGRSERITNPSPAAIIPSMISVTVRLVG